MNIPTKALIHSKTFWFGLLQIAFGAIGLAFGFLDHETAMTLIFTGLGTIGFRTGTTQPIGSVFTQ